MGPTATARSGSSRSISNDQRRSGESGRRSRPAPRARVVDVVNRGPLFDPLYVYPPLLDAAALTVGPTFKLSSLHARTLRPGSTVLDIHVDVEHDSTD
jgi:hypothetical protein